MLYTKAKKEALSIYEHAVEKYNNTYQTMQETGSRLYSLRQDSVKLIQEIELLLNSIANKPKEFEKTISMIASKQLEVLPFVDDVVSLDQVQDAYERLTSGVDPAVKILVDPNK